MPNIRTFDAPSLSIRPSETGVEARAATARRVGGFYNQEASDLQQLGRETESLGSFEASNIRQAGSAVAGGIKSAGDAYVNSVDHQEISHGTATFAALQDDLTKQWNETIKTANPNDPSVAAKFRETVMQPALENFNGAFSTEKSQAWAESHTAALTQHFYQKTAADMSTMAGIAVRQNVDDATKHMSSTAISDPTSVPFLLESVDHSIGGIVGSSPTLSPIDGARIKSEVATQTKANIVKYGAIGAIQKSGDPEKTADEWVKKYPDYIDGAEAKALAGAARQQIRARNYDFETDRRRQKEIAQDKSTEASNQYLIDVRSRDPRIAGDPTAVKIFSVRST